MEELARIVERMGEEEMVDKTQACLLSECACGGKLPLVAFRLCKCHHLMCVLHMGSWKCVYCRERLLGQVQLFRKYSALQQHVPVLPLSPPKQPTGQTFIMLYM